MSKFNFIETEIPGVVVIEPTVFGDDRGYFMETYQIDDFAAAGIDKPFVQDNQSRSTKGVLRGLHFQKNHTQGKLVRVTMGEVYDVAVDCRPNSKTFGKWVGVTLSAENKKMFYIPEGFAHGFLVLSDVAEFCYKCTDVYDPTAEGGIPYDDPTVNVQWPDCGCEHKTSAKDKEHTPFAEQKFEYYYLSRVSTFLYASNNFVISGGFQNREDAVYWAQNTKHACSGVYLKAAPHNSRLTA